MNYFSELKRRNVFKVAIAYLMLSWLILQIIDVLTPALFLPEMLMRVVFVVLAMVFPVILIITWAFELTPDGFKKTDEVDADESIRKTTGQKINYAIIGFLVLVIGFQFWMNTDTPDTERANTIAVMPFADMSPDGSQEYFGDGIAEEILNVLVGIDELTVTSRTSSFAFKDQNLLTPAIAEQLKVNYILQGSIRSTGDRVRVTAQLIDVDADSQMWSDTYDRDLTDIFAIQDEISRSIAEALRIELVGGTPLKIASTENMEAYELYLQGHELFLARDSGLSQALELLERAVELDENFAEAWAELAFVIFDGRLFDTDFEIERSLAIEAANRAISLDPNLSQAWAAKGQIFLWQQQFLDSEIALRRALELNPNNETARFYLGVVFQHVGSFDRAIEAMERAIELNPNTAVYYSALSNTIHMNGDIENALTVADKVYNEMEFDPPYAFGAILAVANNELERAIEELINFYEYEYNLSGEEIAAKLAIYVNAYFDPSTREEALEFLKNDIVDGNTVPGMVYLMLQDGEMIIDYFDNRDAYSGGYFSRLYYPLSRPLFKQKVVRDYFIKIGLLEYWKINQFPSFCRPIGDDDFECE